MIRVFDMFAGYGGSEFALKLAKIKHKCIGFSEIDKAAIKCFDNNHPNIKNFGDCNAIDVNELDSFNLLTAGFPCQPFSEAGKHKGGSDTRGTLFHEIIRIAEAKSPEYMLLENVKGLTFTNHSNTFRIILSELDRINYTVYWKVLNSRDYGIPQSRERVIFVCYRKDIKHNFKFPEKLELKIFLKDIVDPPTKKTIVSMARRNINRSKHQAKGLDYKTNGGLTFPKKIHWYAKNKKPADVGVSYAVKSALHEYSIAELHDKSDLPDLDTVRPLTPKEAFRLMGFLNDEINLDGLTKLQKYKLAGNGWDVNLISKVLAEMFSVKPKARSTKQMTLLEKH